MAETRMIGKHIQEYRDWRSAAEASRARKAISRDMLTVHVPPFHGHSPMVLRAHLCIEIQGGKMTWRFHSAQGLPVEYLPRPHASDIDRVAWWRAW